jgi:xanthine dehydrogenase molybdopterin-binding subunit B
VSIDKKAALACPGVAGVFTAADIRGSNLVGHVGDEALFATTHV